MSVRLGVRACASERTRSGEMWGGYGIFQVLHRGVRVGVCAGVDKRTRSGECVVGILYSKRWYAVVNAVESDGSVGEQANQIGIIRGRYMIPGTVNNLKGGAWIALTVYISFRSILVVNASGAIF